MSIFEKLAPFIQEYIWNNEWESLKEIQIASCDVIFNSNNNLLLATPTASGKTEAAFLPIITELYNKPSSSVGVLYIAPLKALINDQFVRIDLLLQHAHIEVTKWHGDVSQTKKNKLLKKPQGVLQITPESLEAMLMNRKQNIITLFSDLRFIIIDEVHNFLGQDRGVQLSTILERIQILTDNIPRRIGLSATIGDLSVAEKWLCAGTNRNCVTPNIKTERRKMRIMLDHFYILPKKEDVEEESWLPYYQSLYNLTQSKKCIIFSNSRAEVERNIINLKELAEKKNERDVFFVHHGNISTSNREYAEEQMKESDLPLVTGATVTLELGIDLGDLDRIVQTGCPHSVSSLAQRLGRSGRRSGISEMSFVFNEERNENDWYKNIEWNFIKCIALIELYREGWIEPTKIDKYPFNVLYHQTMSFLYSHGEASPSFLAQTILGLSAFSNITQDEYRKLLQSMIEIGHLEKTESGGLLVGQQGEFLTNHYSFFTIFETMVEYSVRDKTYEIGTLNDLVPLKTTFVLAGKTWTVIELDKEQKVIYVESAKGKPPTNWIGSDYNFEYTKVLQKMKTIIADNISYPYLTLNAKIRLEEIQNTVKQLGILDTDIFEIKPNTFGILLWLGTRTQNAFCFALSKKLPDCIIVKTYWPLLIIKKVTEENLLKAIKTIKINKLTINDLALPSEIPPIGKYGQYVPECLRYKQFVDKYIDLKET